VQQNANPNWRTIRAIRKSSRCFKVCSLYLQGA
jgi:hypothetical protein